jgi:hypothetical protein
MLETLRRCLGPAHRVDATTTDLDFSIYMLPDSGPFRDLIVGKTAPAAASAIQAVAERGLSVPGDAAVVGFDDIQIAALLQPSLTTIRQDMQGLGTAAAEALATEIR